MELQVDESVNKVQSRVPPTLLETAQNAPAAARAILTEVKTTGVVGTASGLAKTVYAKYEPAAKDLYTKYQPVAAAKDLMTKYEPVAEQYAATAWHSLNRLPLFTQVVQAVAPTASYYTGKYNQTVTEAAVKGYKVASHLPLVPSERIAKVLAA